MKSISLLCKYHTMSLLMLFTFYFQESDSLYTPILEEYDSDWDLVNLPPVPDSSDVEEDSIVPIAEEIPDAEPASPTYNIVPKGSQKDKRKLLDGLW